MFWAPDLFVLEQIVPERTGDEETVGGRRHAREDDLGFGPR